MSYEYPLCGRPADRTAQGRNVDARETSPNPHVWLPDRAMFCGRGSQCAWSPGQADSMGRSTAVDMNVQTPGEIMELSTAAGR